MNFNIVLTQYFEIIKENMLLKAIEDKRLELGYSNVKESMIHKDFFFEIKKRQPIDKQNYKEEEDFEKVFYSIFFKSTKKEGMIDILDDKLLNKLHGNIKQLKLKAKNDIKLRSYNFSKSKFSFDFKFPIFVTIDINNTSSIFLGSFILPLNKKTEKLFLHKLFSAFEDINTHGDRGNIIKKDENVYLLPWDKIQFLNKEVLIEIKERKIRIPLLVSTIHHERLKRILFKKDNSGIKIDLSSNPYKIIDIEILVNLIKYFDILIRYNNSSLSLPEFKKFTLEIQKPNPNIQKVWHRDLYTRKLIEIHNKDLPVIPVFEFNGTIQELSYIFSVQTKKSIILVWENFSENRATYLFKSNAITYYNDCQNLYDYVISRLRRKRFGIFIYKEQLEKVGVNLPFLKKIYHSNYAEWEKTISLEFKKI